MAKARNIHFALSEDNPREAAILSVIERDAQGMTLKEYVCRLVENSGIEQRMARIEALLAEGAVAPGAGQPVVRPRPVPEGVLTKTEACAETFAHEEHGEDVEDLDDDVMDFLSGLNS
jgi:hypothetical protein